METDIGNPIEYNPTLDEQEKNEDNNKDEMIIIPQKWHTHLPSHHKILPLGSIYSKM